MEKKELERLERIEDKLDILFDLLKGRLNTYKVSTANSTNYQDQPEEGVKIKDILDEYEKSKKYCEECGGSNITKERNGGSDSIRTYYYCHDCQKPVDITTIPKEENKYRKAILRENVKECLGDYSNLDGVMEIIEQEKQKSRKETLEEVWFFIITEMNKLDINKEDDEIRADILEKVNKRIDNAIIKVGLSKLKQEEKDVQMGNS